MIEHTGGERGWIGDSPLILLDCSRLRALGWTPRLTIAEAVERPSGGSTPTPGSSRSVHERRLREGASAAEPGRRRHGPTVVLPRARGFPRRGRDRPVRIPAHAHGLSAPLPPQILLVGRGRRPRANPAPDPPRDARAALARESPGDRLDRRHPGGDGARIVRVVHRLPPQVAGGRRAPADHARCDCRGRVSHRDRRARRADRQAGSVRSGAWRHLRLHVSSGRHGHGRAAATRFGRDRVDGRPPPAVLHRRDTQGRRAAR